VDFILSKVLWRLVQPGNALALLLVLGAVLLFSRHDGRRRFGRGMVAVSAVGFFVFALFPVGTWLGRPLEDRFPRTELPAQVDGIIMLGGAVTPPLAVSRGEPSVNDAAERVLAMAELGRRYPDAKLVFTGGYGALWGDYSEGEFMRAALEQAGLDTGRVLFEGESRNTWENAVLSRDLAAVKPGETWVLITSAWHMPRSVGIFRRVGWPVVPYPVDYRTRADGKPPVVFDLADNLDKGTVAAREWIGLLAYHLMGRTDALFPAPLTAEPDGKGLAALGLR